MKKLFLFLILSICVLNTGFSADLPIDKQTYIYSIKGSDTLRLDKYEIADSQTVKPCVIFVFGGGFVNGSRNDEGNVQYLTELAKRGYAAVAIDYRLGMRSAVNMQGADPMEFVNLLGNTISMAVEDLFDATNYVLQHAGQWNINKDQIIANGSSAGAVTVLQAEYEISTGGTLSKKLPDGFNYGGIISFAGAVFSTDGDFKWEKRPAPIQMFHGNGDSNVPYGKIEMFNMGLYGSQHIAEQLKNIESPYYFYDVNNAAHEIAGSPMRHNLSEICSFIQNYVIDKKPLIIHAAVDEIGKPEIRKNFEIMDYIKSNYIR